MSDLISREFMKSIGGTCIAQRLKDGDLCPIISIDLLPSVEPERKCESCRYRNLEWYEEPCDSCTMGGEGCHYKPERKKGKWLMNGERYGHMYWRCSQCGEEVDYIGANFCSNCGSYMKGDK